jgi:hypothetical protein
MLSECRGPEAKGKCDIVDSMWTKHRRPLWPRSGPAYCGAEWPVSDELTAVQAVRFFGAATAVPGRLPTDAILRPPAA